MKDDKKNYLEYVKETCLDCSLCTRNCDFLTKYGLDLADFASRDDLAYSCFLCGRCYEVCPVDLDGREISLIHRKNEGFGMMKFEKSLYKFRNNSNKKTKDLLWLGCAFPRAFPETTKKMIEIFREDGCDYSIDCCGKPVFESGDKDRAQNNIDHVKMLLLKKKVKRVVTCCPNCYHFFKDYTDINVITIYEKLYELGVGKVLEDEFHIYHPCPDKVHKEMFKDLKHFMPNAKSDYKDVLCCGLGGLASRDEPEIAKAFLDRLKNYESMVTTYCASCSIQFTKNGIANQHALTMILGTDEKVVPTSLARLIKMKFYGGR